MSEFYIADCTGLLQGDWLCAKCKRTEKKPRPTSGMKTKVVVAAPASADGRGVQALSRDRELLRTPTNVSRESSGPNFNKALFLPGGLPDDIELGYYVKGQVSGNTSVTLLCRSMCSYQAIGYCK
jgi:hypothetical protein